MEVQLPMDNLTHAHAAAFLISDGRLEVCQSRIDPQLVAAHADDPAAAGAHWNVLRSASLDSFMVSSRPCQVICYTSATVTGHCLTLQMLQCLPWCDKHLSRS